MVTLRPIVVTEKNSLRTSSGRKKPRKRRSRKRLAYGVIAVAFILACFLLYFSLHSSPPKVAIVDHLSFYPEQRNQTIVDACKNIVKEGGLTWAYHKGEEVTVNFYRNLPSYGTSLIILRVHSAIMKTETGTISILGLFSSERYSPEAARKYQDDVSNDRLVEAFFSEEERVEGISYFGIVPKFVEESMKGEFRDAVVIMMGCEGLGYINEITGARVTYTDMAEAFINKGAKVYIGWNGPVGVNHTDQATIRLLQSLIVEKRTIGEAVEETSPDPDYNSELHFYPAEVGNYRITNLARGLTSSVVETSTICVRFRRSRVKPLQ